MTVPVQNAFSTYTGTGSRTFFEYGFPADETTPVVVVVDGDPVDYTQQATGVVITPAPELGAIVVIYRWTSVDQLLDFQPFESFDADKTEFAVDKLIQLKQEAWQYRAWLILFADHLLDRVRLINYHGDDADAFLWDTERNVDVEDAEAGMFAGMVADDIPQAGAIVDKPWNFVYFLCGAAPVGEVVTSTLYPIDVTEEAQIGADLASAYMNDFPNDNLNVGGDLVGVTITAVRLIYGPDEDNVNVGGDLVAVTITETKIEYGPDEDNINVGGDLVQVVIKPGKVDAFAPDEEVQTGCDLDPTNCYMVDA